MAEQSEVEYVDPIVIVTGPLGGRHTILWLEEYEAKTQTLVPTAEVLRGSLTDPNSVVFYAIQRKATGGERELGVVYDAASFGSRSPVARFALLRLEEGEWRVQWDSGVADGWRGSHGTVEFSNGDLSELVVRRDSSGEGRDELSAVLYESNSGPHRYFVDTWVREGDTYVRQSAETVAAPYATLVEFLYALSIGDEVGAREQVTEAELATLARDFGMDTAPGQYWFVNCDNGFTCGMDEPMRLNLNRTQGERPGAVYFEGREWRWRRSYIQPNVGS